MQDLGSQFAIERRDCFSRRVMNAICHYTAKDLQDTRVCILKTCTVSSHKKIPLQSARECPTALTFRTHVAYHFINKVECILLFTFQTLDLLNIQHNMFSLFLYLIRRIFFLDS